MSFSDHGTKSNDGNRKLQLSLRGGLFNEKTPPLQNTTKDYTKPLSLSNQSISRANRIRRNKLIKQAAIFILLLIPSLMFVSNKFFSLIEKLDQTHTHAREDCSEEFTVFTILEEYHYFVKLGDYYLNKKRYTMARVQFQKAIDLFPTGKKANIGLAKTLYKLCEEKGEFCELSKEYNELEFNL